MSKSIIRQIIELESKSASDLRQIYNEIMPKKCAANTNKEFLRPRIAFRLQELAFGGLDDESKENLAKIANGISPIFYEDQPIFYQELKFAENGKELCMRSKF